MSTQVAARIYNLAPSLWHRTTVPTSIEYAMDPQSSRLSMVIQNAILPPFKAQVKIALALVNKEHPIAMCCPPRFAWRQPLGFPPNTMRSCRICRQYWRHLVKHHGYEDPSHHQAWDGRRRQASSSSAATTISHTESNQDHPLLSSTVESLKSTVTGAMKLISMSTM